MKRILLCTLMLAALPALAQVTTNPNAKVDPKNNKVGRPVVEKPKVKLMTRDELRACLLQFDKNEAEAKDIKAAQTSNLEARASLVKAKEDLLKEGNELDASAVALKAERADLVKAQDEIKEKLPKMERAAAEALLNDYKARAAAHDVKVDAYNVSKTKYAATAKDFDAKIETHNQSSKELAARTETHLDSVEDWKTDCSKKSYDEADEIAIRKELGLKK